MSSNTKSCDTQMKSTQRPTYELLKPVFFVGFMGAGKTTISRLIARRKGLVSIDMDSYIERQQGCSINNIFKTCGEAGFRDIETQLLRKFAAGDAMLISCGGGIVVKPENRNILKQSGCVVFLKTTAAQSKKWINNLTTRPLFNNLEEAEQRNLERLPLYEEVASLTVDVVGKSKNITSREVTRRLYEAGVLVKHLPEEPRNKEDDLKGPRHVC